MKPKTNRKINQNQSPKSELEIRKFFDIRPKAESADANKIKTIFLNTILRLGSYIKKFPKRSLRGLRNIWIEARLESLRAKALRAEMKNTENGSLYKALPKSQYPIPDIQQKPKCQILKVFKNFVIKIYLKIKNYKIKNLYNRRFLKKSFAFITIVAVIVMAYFQNAPMASAATFTLYQTQWLSVNASEAHSGQSQTTITTYSAKDANLSAGTELTLSPAAGTPITQTYNSNATNGFNLTGNTKSNVEVLPA